MSTAIVPSTPSTIPRQPRTAPPCALVIFGASGDLTHRKLVPALFRLKTTGAIDERFAVVGVARRDWSSEGFRSDLGAAVRDSSNRAAADERAWAGFAPMLHWVSGSFEDADTYTRLKSKLESLDRERGLEGNRLYYLATPPSAFETILGRLSQSGLITRPNERPCTRVVIEKPFGRALDSARALNALIA